MVVCLFHALQPSVLDRHKGDREDEEGYATPNIRGSRGNLCLASPIEEITFVSLVKNLHHGRNGTMMIPINDALNGNIPRRTMAIIGKAIEHVATPTITTGNSNQSIPFLSNASFSLENATTLHCRRRAFANRNMTTIKMTIVAIGKTSKR